jgi:hypothetical protein
MPDDKSAVEKLADTDAHDPWFHRDALRAAIEVDRAAEVGAYGRAMQTIRDMRTRFAKESQEHARKARALDRAEAEVERLRAGSRCPECSATEWNEAARQRQRAERAEAKLAEVQQAFHDAEGFALPRVDDLFSQVLDGDA